jgi:hypothetical protein
MSSTWAYDRHGGCKNFYAHRSGNPSAALQANTWWPDFAPGKDHSYLLKSHPAETMFDKGFAHYKWDATDMKPGLKEAPVPEHKQPMPKQFRHPAPGNEAMLQRATPTMEAKLQAHATTQKQASLLRAEMRQRQVDSWANPSPIRMAASSSVTEGGKDLSMYAGSGILCRPPSLSRSEPILQLSPEKAASVSRSVYEQHGYLVGRSKGQTADGKTGLRPRKHTPLSAHKLKFGGDGTAGKPRSSKPGGQWKSLPESGFVFDPKSFLPVPRGGRNKELPDRWPEPPNDGRRCFSSGPFENTASTMSGGSAAVTTFADIS